MNLLTEEFLSKYPDQPEHMSELGSFVFYRTYSRWLPSKQRRETWKECVARSVDYNTSISLQQAKRIITNFPFDKIKAEIAPQSDDISIIYSDSIYDYFRSFNEMIRETDILWTKPSELSFYSGLGLPIIMTPAIGSQEIFNQRWLIETGAGVKQLDPEYADQWLFDFLNSGRLAEAAWAGFLKVRKLGTYKIMDIIETGKMTDDSSPVLR
jgi:hypothetical protein